MLFGPESCEKRSRVTRQVGPGSNHATYMFELLGKVLLVVVIYSAFVQCLIGWIVAVGLFTWSQLT